MLSLKHQRYRAACACLAGGMSVSETAAHLGISRRGIISISKQLTNSTGWPLAALRQKAKDCPDEAAIGEMLRQEAVANRPWAGSGDNQGELRALFESVKP
jgi:hypothetical protein